MQKTLEFPLGGNRWLQYKVAVEYSRNGNYFVKHAGKVYVFSDVKTGTPVVTKENGKWVTAGRMAPFTIFIGAPDQLSRFEWERTPAGKAQIEADFNRFVADLHTFKTSPGANALTCKFWSRCVRRSHMNPLCNGSGADCPVHREIARIEGIGRDNLKAEVTVKN